MAPRRSRKVRHQELQVANNPAGAQADGGHHHQHLKTQSIEKQFQKATKKERRALIFQQRNKNQQDKKVRFIYTHNQSNPPFHIWVRECKKLLTKNPKAKNLGNRIQLASKQSKNLQQLVGGHRGGSGGGGGAHPSGCWMQKMQKMSCLP